MLHVSSSYHDPNHHTLFFAKAGGCVVWLGGGVEVGGGGRPAEKHDALPTFVPDKPTSEAANGEDTTEGTINQQRAAACDKGSICPLGAPSHGNINTNSSRGSN